MQSDHELAFWRNLAAQHGDGFIDFRASEYKAKTEKFPGFEAQQGLGLDLGCGLVSVFEKSAKDVVVCDPLADEYVKIIPNEKLKKPMLQKDGENLNFGDNLFEWVFCTNVIDHTPNPQKMADEIYRILSPGGKLYFEVNFDDHLSPAHYGIWDVSMVDKYFSKFKQEWVLMERNPSYPQTLFYAIYTK